jgi:hypothetical protein
MTDYAYVAGQAGIPEHFDGCVCLRFLNTCLMSKSTFWSNTLHLPFDPGTQEMRKCIVW